MPEYVVLGGAGTIGKVAVRDLLESRRDNRVLVADYDEAGATRLARSLKSRRVRPAFADASKVRELTRLLRGTSAVVNCTQHDFNLNVMEACLAAGVHYVDLGGLFTYTRRQLRLDREFRKAGIVAVLGAGCAPGITNVMARYGADLLERVQDVRIRVGTRSFEEAQPGFAFPYSPQTIVEEMTLPPYVYERGTFRKIEPRSRWERVEFPDPVGPQWTVCTRHSEVATLPLTLRDKGVRRCDFHVGFDRPFVRELVKRLEAGSTVADFARLPMPRKKPDDYEIARVVLVGRGTPDGEELPAPLRGTRRPARRVTVDCHARANPRWHAFAGDIDTGCPPSIVAQMIVDGTIAKPGVHAPEAVVPPGPFFEALARRGMDVIVSEE